MNIVYRSEKGSKLTSDEVDGNFRYLESFINPNRIEGLGTETVEGNQYTYQGYSWIINGVNLDNIDTPSVIVIPSAAIGFRRKDISVFNKFGNVVRVPGVETDGDIATTPDVPDDTIYFRTYDIVGDLISSSDDEPTFVGLEYKSKRESVSHTYSTSGASVLLPLRGEGQNHYIVDNENLISVHGFDKTLLRLVRNAEWPYEGKDYLFENKSPNPVQLNHLTNAEIPFVLPNEENLIIPSGGCVWFKFKGDQMAFIMKSWNDPVDISQKADLVGGKVPASQLPAYVDDVLEFANLAAFPAIGETGKIYVALDTNSTYRWSGSAYVQIGGGGKRLYILQTDIAFFNSTASSQWWTFPREGLRIATPVFYLGNYDPILETYSENRCLRWTLPFNCRLIDANFKYSTLTNPMRLNVFSFKQNDNGNIFQGKTIASKLFPSDSSSMRILSYTGSEIDNSYQMNKGDNVTLCANFNGLAAGGIRVNCLTLVFEEI